MTKPYQIIHYFIYLNFITGFLSALYMVFIVYAPESGISPLWNNVHELSQDDFLRRRLYALEAWILFCAGSIYFGVTSYKNALKSK